MLLWFKYVRLGFKRIYHYELMMKGNHLKVIYHLDKVCMIDEKMEELEKELCNKYPNLRVED